MKPSEGQKGDIEKNSAPQSGSGQSDAEQRIARYLKAHPDFFLRHPGLLEELRVPHPCGDAVSLIEYQVAVLRERNQRLRRKIQELINNARLNEDLSRRLHRLTLSLLRCGRVDDVFATLYQALTDEFKVDMATVRVFAPPRLSNDRGLGEFTGRDPQALQLFDPVLKSGKPVCGRLKAAHLQYLFAERGAEVGSGALLPLGERERFGVLAIGSRAPHRFHAGMGTLFLRHLGEVVTHVVGPYVAFE